MGSWSGHGDHRHFDVFWLLPLCTTVSCTSWRANHNKSRDCLQYPRSDDTCFRSVPIVWKKRDSDVVTDMVKRDPETPTCSGEQSSYPDQSRRTKAKERQNAFNIRCCRFTTAIELFSSLQLGGSTCCLRQYSKNIPSLRPLPPSQTQ